MSIQDFHDAANATARINMAKIARATGKVRHIPDKYLKIFAEDYCRDNVGQTAEHTLALVGGHTRAPINGSDMVTRKGTHVEIKHVTITKNIKIGKPDSHSAVIANLDGKDAPWVAAIVTNSFRPDQGAHLGIPHNYFKHRQNLVYNADGSIMEKARVVLDFYVSSKESRKYSLNIKSALMQFYLPSFAALSKFDFDNRDQTDFWTKEEWPVGVERYFEECGYFFDYSNSNRILSVVKRIKRYLRKNSTHSPEGWRLNEDMLTTRIVKECNVHGCHNHVNSLSTASCSPTCAGILLNQAAATDVKKLLDDMNYDLNLYKDSTHVEFTCRCCNKKYTNRTSRIKKCANCKRMRNTYVYIADLYEDHAISIDLAPGEPVITGKYYTFRCAYRPEKSMRRKVSQLGYVPHNLSIKKLMDSLNGI